MSDTVGSTADSLPSIEKMPVLTAFVKAEYPADLVKKGIEGTVVMDLIVSDSGRVDSVAIVKGVDPRLDSSAAKAARAFVFSPAMAGGKPVAVLMEYAYHFTIDEVVTAIDRVVNFTGRLFERGTRAPIANATVVVNFRDTAADTSIKVPFNAYLKKIGGFNGQYLQEGALVAVTDSAGSFAFASLPAGRITVKVVVPDFDGLVDSLRMKRGIATDVVYRLQRIAYGDNETVVYGKAEKKEVAQRTLTLQEVQKIPGLGGDAVKVIQALPGVARASFGSGSVTVRGSGTGDTHFYIDGVTIPKLFHFGDIKSTYNSDALESVNLYPGGFGTEYGGAMAGVVEIKGRKPKTDRPHGYLDANFYDASFLVEGPISDKFSLLLTARRSYIADLLSFTLKKLVKIELPFSVAPYYWDYVGRLDYAFSKKQHFYLTLFGSEDKLDLTVNEVRGGSKQISDQTNKAVMDTYFHLGIFGWDWDMTNVLKNELRFAMGYDYEGMSMFSFFKQDGSFFGQYIRDKLTYAVSDAVKWNFGLDMQIIPYDLNMATTDYTNTIVRDTSHFNIGPRGGFCNLEWKPIKRLLLIPGIRYDYYPELNFKGPLVPEFWNYHAIDNDQGTSGVPAFRMTAKYELTKGHLIKASAGTYNETPQPLGEAIDKNWGNPKLPAQEGAQYVAGYEWKLSELDNADVQCYYNQQWDDAREPSKVEMANNPSLPAYIGNGKARMWGLELLLKHDQGKRFFGWIAYSISRSERWNYNQNDWAIYSRDQTHNLQLIGSYRLTPSQELGLRLRYVTGNPTTPVYPSTEVDVGPARRYARMTGAYNSGRMDPFVSLDLRYEKKFSFNSWRWFLYCDITHIENLFGYGFKSPEYSEYEWNYDYTEKSVFSMYTVPSLGMKVEF